jgi:hypothetical protein
MKPLVLLKWSFLLGTLSVALLPAPSCKAQEIVGDQWDSPNTEPFEKPKTSIAPEANKTNHTTKSKQTAVAAKGQSRKSTQNRSAQILSASDRPQTAKKGSAAIQRELNTAQRKPKDE